MFCVSVASFTYTEQAATVPSTFKEKNQINCMVGIPKTKLMTQQQLCNVFKTLPHTPFLVLSCLVAVLLQNGFKTLARLSHSVNFTSDADNTNVGVM